MTEPRLPRDRESLLNALDEQLAMIASLCADYDRGEIWKAKFIASHIYMLVHDGGGRVKSLLGQLGVRGTVKFMSTSKGLDTFPSALCIMRMDERGTDLIPHCHAPFPATWVKSIRFDQWWEEPIIQLATSNTITRKNLVYYLRNNDGAGHVDATLPTQYTELMENNDYTVTISVNGEPRPIPNIHLPAMRQIGWEIQESVAIAITCNQITGVSLPL